MKARHDGKSLLTELTEENRDGDTKACRPRDHPVAALIETDGGPGHQKIEASPEDQRISPTRPPWTCAVRGRRRPPARDSIG